MNSDFKADVRALSFSVDLTRGGSDVQGTGIQRQDFSLQNATVLPLNDARAFLATMKFLTASNPAKAFARCRIATSCACSGRSPWLSFSRDNGEALSAASLLEQRSVSARRNGLRQTVGLAVPSNPARPLKRNNSDALRDELARHVEEDDVMSSFDFGLQLLDVERMTYWANAATRISGSKTQASNGKNPQPPSSPSPA